MPIFEKIVDLVITFWFALKEYWSMLGDVYTGYYNLFASSFRYISDEEIEKHDNKAKLCNNECPLRGKLLGITVCDLRKEHDGINGCGCVRKAKLWSDSPCPLGKF